MEFYFWDKNIESCKKIINETPKMEGLNLSKKVSRKHQYFWQSTTETDLTLEKVLQKNLKN